MNYYIATNDEALKVAGYYPQTYISPKKGFDPYLADSFWNVRYNIFPDFTPKLRLDLYKNSIATDCIYGNSVSFGFIVNKRLKDVLSNHNLPPHRFYPIEVYQDDKKLNYYWFHFITKNFIDWIDKDVSSLLIRNIKPDRRHEVLGSIDLKQSYEKVVLAIDNIKDPGVIYWEELTFNNNFPEYDIIYTNELKFLTLISEKLKLALDKAQITGLEYKLFDKIVS